MGIGSSRKLWWSVPKPMNTFWNWSTDLSSEWHALLVPLHLVSWHLDCSMVRWWVGGWWRLWWVVAITVGDHRWWAGMMFLRISSSRTSEVRGQAGEIRGLGMDWITWGKCCAAPAIRQKRTIGGGRQMVGRGKISEIWSGQPWENGKWGNLRIRDEVRWQTGWIRALGMNWAL